MSMSLLIKESSQRTIADSETDLYVDDPTLNNYTENNEDDLDENYELNAKEENCEDDAEIGDSLSFKNLNDSNEEIFALSNQIEKLIEDNSYYMVSNNLYMYIYINIYIIN
jgi:hypothetical protein